MHDGAQCDCRRKNQQTGDEKYDLKRLFRRAVSDGVRVWRWRSAAHERRLTECVRCRKLRNSQPLVTGDGDVIGGRIDPFWNTFVGISIDETRDNTTHVERGSLALADGSARETTTPQLREFISRNLDALAPLLDQQVPEKIENCVVGQIAKLTRIEE